MKFFKLLIGIFFFSSSIALSTQQDPQCPRTILETARNLIRSKVLYFPWKNEITKIPNYAQEIWATTDDGVKINGWFVPPPKDRPIILYFHGNRGNITLLSHLLDDFKSLDFGVLVVDYRGYGKSTGSPSEQGLYLDGMASLKFLSNNGYNSNQIIIHGRSLGGGVATYLAEKNNFLGMILESTYTSIEDSARERVGKVVANFLMRQMFPNLERLKKINTPLFVIHGKNDQVVHYSHGLSLFEASPSTQKKMWTVNSNHNDLYTIAGEDYKRNIKEFINEILSKK